MDDHSRTIVEGAIVELQRSTLQVCYEWRIERYLSMLHFHRIQSPRISLNDVTWCMNLIPNCHLLDLLISCKCQGSPVALEMAFCVRGPGGEEHKAEKKGEFKGFFLWQVWSGGSGPKIAKLTHRLLQEDGSFVLHCDIKIARNDAKALAERQSSVKEDDAKALAERQSSVKEAIEELHSSLRRLYESREGCDVMVKVQGKEFPVHKCILQSRSPVFQAMFSHNMLERAQNTINIEDLDPDTFPSFLEHIYTGSVGMISASNVLSLFTAADKYDLRALKKECSQFMRRNMTVSSFCDVNRIVVKHGEKELIEHATEFFCSNSLAIVKTPEWRIFLEENLTVGNELVIKAFSKYNGNTN